VKNEDTDSFYFGTTRRNEGNCSIEGRTLIERLKEEPSTLMLFLLLLHKFLIQFNIAAIYGLHSMLMLLSAMMPSESSSFF
jgi:hypothetical protein